MVKRFQYINQTGTRGGNHGRLELPKVTKLLSKSKKQKGGMVRSGTRIRPGITA